MWIVTGSYPVPPPLPFTLALRLATCMFAPVPPHPHTLSLRPHMQGHTDVVTCVAVTLDGESVVSGSHDGSLHIWKLDSGELKGRIEVRAED